MKHDKLLIARQVPTKEGVEGDLTIIESKLVSELIKKTETKKFQAAHTEFIIARKVSSISAKGRFRK